MKTTNKKFCQCWFLPALAALLLPFSLKGQGIVFVQECATIRSTNGLPPGDIPITFPEDALGTYVGASLPIVINGQTVMTFNSSQHGGFTVITSLSNAIISQQPFPSFPDNIWVAPLAAGQEIGPTAAGYGWLNGSMLLASAIDGGIIGEPPLTAGYFVGVEAAYFGFEFIQSGKTYYGWVSVGSPYVSVVENNGWVYNYAYATIPDAPIVAGAVPLTPLAPARIVRPGNLRLKWQSQVGLAYQVQFKQQLNSSGWSNMDFTIVATSTNIAADVPIVGSTRFYRVVQVP